MGMPLEKEEMKVSELAYKWKINLYNVDAQTAGSYLRSLEQRDGEVNPEVVVNESRSEGSVLHPCFEWDDQKAAKNYRIQQAKGIIRNIVIVHEEEGSQEEPIKVRAFVHTSDGEQKYIHIETALSDEILKQQMLQQALHELDEFERKYRDLLEFADLFSTIREFKELRKLA